MENEPLGFEQLQADLDKENIQDKTKLFHQRKVCSKCSSLHYIKLFSNILTDRLELL